MRERIIGKCDASHHDGLRSTRRRLESAMSQIRAYRNERAASHETGEDEPELCFPGEIGGHFQIPSGEIFKDPEVQAMMETNHLPIIDVYVADLADKLGH